MPRFAGIIAALSGVAASAVVWMLATALLGIGLIVCGVYVLAGFGWALIAGGASALGVAMFIRKGLTDG